MRYDSLVITTVDLYFFNFIEIYLYSSGDNNAAKGNPELLYVYSMNEKEIRKIIYSDPVIR